MLVLLDTPQDLAECERDLGVPVGQLLSPTTRRLLQDASRPWAMDNGAFGSFSAATFTTMLEREARRRNECLFVTVPDIVGSARRTLEVFDRWKARLGGWRLALVCQDGQEDFPIPWDEIDAVFIGGSTQWKCGPHAAHIVRTAKILDKWVHAGRVNTPLRFRHFEELGADSCDGTGMARHTHMREAVAARHDQQELLDGGFEIGLAVEKVGDRLVQENQLVDAERIGVDGEGEGAAHGRL